MQKQTIPENSNEQTNGCLTGTLCTITAFNYPPQSRKLALFAFGSVTTLQERLQVIVTQVRNFRLAMRHLFLPEESVESFR